MRLIVAFLLAFAFIAPAAQAADINAQNYRHAFTALESGDVMSVESFAHGHDAVLNKVLRGYAMALPGNDYGFEELDSFITENPGWPGLRGIQMIAEQKIPANFSPQQIANWFAAHPAATLVGFYRHMDALNMQGQAALAQKMIRARWVEGDFTPDELAAFYARFGALLDGDTIWERADRLLWKNDIEGTRRVLPYLDSDSKALAEARLALAAQGERAEYLADSLPRNLQDDAGLQYQRLRWLVKNNRDGEADEILQHPPQDLGNAEAWWNQRAIMARRAIEGRDFNLAYRLAALHGQNNPKTIVQAEFLAGFLALRFLNEPDLARQHFQTLYDVASTPMSRARGGYWLGRAYDMLGDKNAAEQAYEDAAALNTVFYGQLAATRLYAEPVQTVRTDPAVPAAVHSAFMERDMIRAIERLSAIGENARARSFFHAAVEAANQRAEFVMLAEVAGHLQRPDLAIQTAKAAAQKNMLIANGAYPVLSHHAPSPPEPAFTHALIRQESLFNADAESPVGAKGLMQLMPRTAKDVAKHMGVRYSDAKLTDPDYNVRLGSEFAQTQIDKFNGSYILALAGYNAGPARVHEWVGEFGDPRRSDVDPVDWIELMPIQETRNYVQRIIENLQIYRAKLNGGQVPLLIINDLRR